MRESKSFSGLQWFRLCFLQLHSFTALSIGAPGCNHFEGSTLDLEKINCGIFHLSTHPLIFLSISATIVTWNLPHTDCESVSLWCEKERKVYALSVWCDYVQHDSLHPPLTGSEEGSGSIVHGQSVDQLSGCGAERPSFEQGESKGSVVWSDVQLQGGMDADQQVDGLDGQPLQPHRVDQRLYRLKHLDDIYQSIIISNINNDYYFFLSLS